MTLSSPSQNPQPDPRTELRERRLWLRSVLAGALVAALLAALASGAARVLAGGVAAGLLASLLPDWLRGVWQRRRPRPPRRHQSAWDPLTALVGVPEFQRRLERALARARRSRPRTLVVAEVLGLERLEAACGPVAVEELMALLARRLESAVSVRDSLCRSARGEFTLLLQDCGPALARRLAGHLGEAVEGLEFAWGPERFAVRARLGLQVVEGARSPQEVVAEAGAAAALAGAGPGGARRYRSGDRERAGAQAGGALMWARRVAAALAGRGPPLGLVVQPVVDASAGRVLWQECLARCPGEGQWVPASRFVAPVQRAGLGPDLDRWVLAQALGRLAGEPGGERRLSVNLGAATLADPGFPEWLQGQLDPALAPRVALEVSEPVALARPDQALALRRALAPLGVAFVLDGAGGPRLPGPLLEALAPTLVKVAVEPGVSRVAELRCRQDMARAVGALFVVKGIGDEAAERAARAAGAQGLQGRAVGPEAPW